MSYQDQNQNQEAFWKPTYTPTGLNALLIVGTVLPVVNVAAAKKTLDNNP